MSGDVPGEISAVSIPAGVTRRLRLEPRALPVVSHHAIGFELEQIINVEILRVLQRSARKPYRWQRQRTSNIRNHVFDRLLPPGGDGQND